LITGGDGVAIMIKLGTSVRDTITGFEGVATRRTETLHGSTQVFVEGRVNGFERDVWIEEGRLHAADEKLTCLVSPITGFVNQIEKVRPPK
jgi:hypothetical protein